MDAMDRDRLPSLVRALQAAGARFAYLFGSQASGRATDGSDIDLAAWFGRKDIAPWTIPGVDFETVDLVVLDDCPLELAGRVALSGKLLFEIDPAERVAWEATTRKIYSDEQPRISRARADFADGARRRGAEAESRSRGRS
jgi:predicted nucleotidyltransferase